MVKGKVELKRIENKINQQVTFTKRRNGLLKKAYELSILFHAELGLIIFSNRGKLYEFCSGSSMTNIIEKYHRCNYAEVEASQPANANDTQRYKGYLKLKAEAEILQQSQSQFTYYISEKHLLGEDLRHLGTNELDQLEHQLDLSLKRVRSTKAQSMLDKLLALQQKQEERLAVNRAIRNKLEESNARVQSSWEVAGDLNIPYRCQSAESETFFEPLYCNNSSQIGYKPAEEPPFNGSSSA